jgi:hypothetical protein
MKYAVGYSSKKSLPIERLAKSKDFVALLQKQLAKVINA